MATTQDKGSQGDVTAAVREESDERIQSRQDEEEKVIIAAWYSMCVALQQQSLNEGSTSSSQAQSFLAQQRLSTQARRSLGLTPRILPR
ncbi:protein Hook homolog 2-like [Hypomesus transpacificus]|uniref:protein Hook homolog 2-like n=1 Tax=Hypomesus transpacificus TaxID=137520 RepID=UPI001F07D4E0|nr:protein Hook homolog 2-like [Hypomesus transpacificus]